jgi:hypothetical protein
MLEVDTFLTFLVEGDGNDERAKEEREEKKGDWLTA